MKTRLHRFAVAVIGVVVAYAPLLAKSEAARDFIENHPALAIYMPLATALALAAYRELVAWKTQNTVKDQSGLTLIEALVVLLLVAVILLALGFKL
jgi:hypothetical protein